MYKIFPLSLILRLDAIFTLARHVQLKIMPIPLFKTKCYQILVSKPLFIHQQKQLSFPSTNLALLHAAAFTLSAQKETLCVIFKPMAMPSVNVSIIISEISI